MPTNPYQPPTEASGSVLSPPTKPPPWLLAIFCTVAALYLPFVSLVDEHRRMGPEVYAAFFGWLIYAPGIVLSFPLGPVAPAFLFTLLMVLGGVFLGRRSWLWLIAVNVLLLIYASFSAWVLPILCD